VNGVPPTEFRGSPARFLWLAGGWLLALAAGTAVFTAGRAWPHLLGTSLLLLSPVLVLLALLVRRFDRFTMDDGAGRFSAPLGRAAAYSEVSGFELIRSGGLLALRTLGGGVSLLFFGDPDDGEPLREAVRRRCPRAEWSERTAPVRLLAAASIGVILAAQAGFALYLRSASPLMSAACEPAAWLQQENAAPEYGPPRRFRNVVFRLPAGFEPAPAAGQHDSAAFVHSGGGVRVTVRPGILERSRQPRDGGLLEDWPLRAIGVRSSYDLLELAYCARIGLIPLVLKIVALSSRAGDSERPPEIYTAATEAWQGVFLISRGEQGGRAEMLLHSPETGAEAEFVVETKGDLDKSLLVEIVRGVEWARGAG